MAFNDPNLPSQLWYLGAGGSNLLAALAEYRGAGVRVGVVDTGIDYTLADLSGRLDLAAGWDALGGDPDPLNLGGDQHGTVVAEYLGARADNGAGGVGAAPGATLVGFRMATRAERTPEQELALLQRQWQVDVSHNSWSYSGESFRDNFLDAYAAHGAAVAHAAANGRGGLGTVVVRSAGNDGAAGDSVNAHNYQNNRFTMTVGAADANGDVQGFSNKGPAVWVVAPENATSYAAPQLSGAVALVLQANPRLGYRDVQQIVALAADFTDGAGPWKTNAAPGFANGGGYRTSTSAGFGMLDALAAVRLAESWEGAPKTEANVLAPRAAGTGFAVPDVGAAAGNVSFAGNMVVERAVLTLDLSHARIGDLVVSLVSPAGTESVLLDRLGDGGHAGGGRLAFALTSNQFYGESGAGAWTLKVQDAVPGRTATVNAWVLELFGAPQAADDLYVYTDRFAGLAAVEPGRRTLSDADGGVDTLNAAAVTTASMIDLRPGSVSTIAGTPLTIAPGTLIERAWGGDGADRIVGNGAANTLNGGRGNDLVLAGPGDDNISGGFGDDTLYGEEGNDAIAGGPGKDVLGGGAGADVFTYASTQESAGLGAGGAGYDVILDFQPGIDRIDLSLIDANPWLPGDQAFTFIPGGLVGTAGQLTLVGNSLFGDTNGDRLPDLDIYLVNVFALGAADIVL
jgi:subtilisin-like proprotein convertase family protein